jgi:hypothetical protein
MQTCKHHSCPLTPCPACTCPACQEGCGTGCKDYAKGFKVPQSYDDKLPHKFWGNWGSCQVQQLVCSCGKAAQGGSSPACGGLHGATTCIRMCPRSRRGLASLHALMIGGRSLPPKASYGSTCHSCRLWTGYLLWSPGRQMAVWHVLPQDHHRHQGAPCHRHQ